MNIESLIPPLIFIVAVIAWAWVCRIDRPACFSDPKAQRGCCAACRHYEKGDPYGRRGV